MNCKTVIIENYTSKSDFTLMSEDPQEREIFMNVSGKKKMSLGGLLYSNGQNPITSRLY